MHFETLFFFSNCRVNITQKFKRFTQRFRNIFQPYNLFVVTTCSLIFTGVVCFVCDVSLSGHALILNVPNKSDITVLHLHPSGRAVTSH